MTAPATRTIERAGGVCDGCGFVNVVEAAVTRMRCGGCGHAVRLTYVIARYNGRVPCNADCQYAYGPNCSCSCGGENHRAGYIKVDMVPVWVRERDRTRHQAKQAKKEAKERAERQTRQQRADARRAELLERWPILARLADEYDGQPRGPFLTDMQLAYVHGSMTDRQAAAAASALEQEQQRQAETDAREQQRKDLVDRGVRVRAGRTTFTGRIVSTKDEPHRFAYGQREWKILVETTEGLRLFGPLPKALEPARGSYDWHGQLRGRVVTLGALLKPSDEDPLFGYFRRPEVVAVHEDAPAAEPTRMPAPSPVPVPVPAGAPAPEPARSPFPWARLIQEMAADLRI